MMLNDALEECRTTAALYSLSILPAEETARFERRLKTGCPVCTSEYAAFTSVTSELAAALPQRTPPASLRDRLFDRIASSRSPSALPKEMTMVRGEEAPWIPLPVPGVEVKHLLGRKTMLVRMQPGAALPSHDHNQAEQCYVLEGSVTDSEGITAFAGDFVCMSAGSKHQEIRTDTGCTFLLAYTA